MLPMLSSRSPLFLVLRNKGISLIRRRVEGGAAVYPETFGGVSWFYCHNPPPLAPSKNQRESAV